MQERSKILAVDDNPDNIDILEEILEDDYELATASSGEEALKIASDFKPALILLDIMMDGIDGYEVCRQIRATQTLSYTKVIMVSAKSDVDDRLQGYEVGADDYVTKPFDEDELLAKVRVYLSLKSVEEIDQFKSNVINLLGHEANTPLNGILPPLEMLLADDDMPVEERRKWLELARASTRNLQRLFQQVTKLSAMKAGQYQFNPVPTSLADVIQYAVGVATVQAEQRHIQLDLTLDEAPPVALDPEHMTEVVRILLAYAIQASVDNGQVRTRFSIQEDVLCLSVTHHGSVIAPELLPHLFDEFASSETPSQPNGLGLDLAIARRIVLAHQGDITVQSEEGKGTTFIVHLPLTSSEDSAYAA